MRFAIEVSDEPARDAIALIIVLLDQIEAIAAYVDERDHPEWVDHGGEGGL